MGRVQVGMNSAYTLTRQLVTATVFAQVEGTLSTFTEEQSAVIEAFLGTNRNLIVKSTAGSGKSTLLRVLATIAPRTPDNVGRMGVFAFNSSIAKELEAKLPRDLIISTFHAFGRKLIERNSSKPIKLVKFKKRNIAQAYLKGLDEALATKAHIAGLVTLAEQMMIYLLPPTQESIDGLCSELELKFAPEIDVLAAVAHVSRVSLEQYEQQGWIDYLDMLYIPLKKGYGKGSMKLMLVDEAQDFSKLQHKLVRHLLAPEGRVVYVGDPAQAIYLFTGADAGGLDQAERFFNALVLRLTYTFRCPRSHVKLAQQFSEHIRTPELDLKGEMWKEGEVKQLTTEALKEELTSGDLVLSRTNAPIIQLALALLRKHKDVHILGVDLKDELGRYFEKAFPQPFVQADIEGRLMAAYDRMLEERFERGENGKVLERGAERDADMLSSVGAIALRACAEKTGACGVNDLNKVLGELLKGGENAINLCTVHKAKGLEADRVAILHPENLIMQNGNPEEEQAVSFVAYTRGKKVLMLASDQKEEEEVTA